MNLEEGTRVTRALVHLHIETLATTLPRLWDESRSRANDDPRWPLYDALLLPQPIRIRQSTVLMDSSGSPLFLVYLPSIPSQKLINIKKKHLDLDFSSFRLDWFFFFFFFLQFVYEGKQKISIRDTICYVYISSFLFFLRICKKNG